MGEEIKRLQEIATNERSKNTRADWKVITKCKLDIMKLERKIRQQGGE